MESQANLKAEIVNKLNNHGIFIQEREVEYEGEEILVYMFMPESLAAKADVVANVIVYDYEEIEKIEFQKGYMEVNKNDNPTLFAIADALPEKEVIEKPKAKPVPKKEIKKVKKK